MINNLHSILKNTPPSVTWIISKSCIEEVGSWKVSPFQATEQTFFILNNTPSLLCQAKLNSFMVLNMIPPSFFSLYREFHDTQWIFGSPCFLPHQNLLIIFSMCSHRLSGILKQLMTYVGITWTTALMRTSSCKGHMIPFPTFQLLPNYILDKVEYLLFRSPYVGLIFYK